MQVADAITILRDGQTIETLDMQRDEVTRRSDHQRDGRPRSDAIAIRSGMPNIGGTIFEVRNWNVYHPLQADRKMIDDVNFHHPPRASGRHRRTDGSRADGVRDECIRQVLRQEDQRPIYKNGKDMSTCPISLPRSERTRLCDRRPEELTASS